MKQLDTLHESFEIELPYYFKAPHCILTGGTEYVRVKGINEVTGNMRTDQVIIRTDGVNFYGNQALMAIPQDAEPCTTGEYMDALNRLFDHAENLTTEIMAACGTPAPEVLPASN